VYTKVRGVANAHDQVSKSDSEIEFLILTLWHWVSDIESLTLSLWHWVSDIESPTLTDIDLTNRSLPTFARCLLKTLEISWDLHRTWRWMMMMSVPCKDSSHAYREESPKRPPPHLRKPHQAPLESQRPQRAPLQSQKPHQAPRQRPRSLQLLRQTIDWSLQLHQSNALQMFVLGLLHPQLQAQPHCGQGEIP